LNVLKNKVKKTIDKSNKIYTKEYNKFYLINLLMMFAFLVYLSKLGYDRILFTIMIFVFISMSLVRHIIVIPLKKTIEEKESIIKDLRNKVE
jgi:ABC-type uncharacterized transport system fused permease/ATPase subunit